MSKIMSLDIETSNYSWQVGGWDATHLFDPTVVATWDGENGHVFSKEDIELEGSTIILTLKIILHFYSQDQTIFLTYYI